MTNITIGGSNISVPTGTSFVSPENVYATLYDLRSYLAMASQNTTDDDNFRDFLQRASRAIDRETNRFFYPERQTYRYDQPNDARTLRIDEEFLEVHGLSHLNGASEVDTSVYWKKNGDLWNKSPYDQIIIDDSSGSLFNFTGTPIRSVVLDATFGYHTDYERRGFINTGTCISSDVSSATSIIYVNGTSAGQDVLGQYPRFSAEQTLRLDDEYIHLISNTGNALHVRRGINGTVAASHASNIPLKKFNVESDVRFMTIRLAAWTFEQTKSPYSNRIAFPQLGGAIEMAESWPQDVKSRLKKVTRKPLYTAF